MSVTVVVGGAGETTELVNVGAGVYESKAAIIDGEITVPSYLAAIWLLGHDEPGDAPGCAWVRADSIPSRGPYFQDAGDYVFVPRAPLGLDIRCIGGKPDCTDTWDVDDVDVDGIPNPNGAFDRDSTNNTAIFQLAQEFSHDHGVPILLGGCTENTGYRMYPTSDPADPGGYVDTTGEYHHLKGTGWTTAKIFLDEDGSTDPTEAEELNAPGAQAAFGDRGSITYTHDANPAFIHEGVEFRGRWHHVHAMDASEGNEGTGAGYTYGRHVEVRNCRFTNIRSKAYIGYGDRSATFDNITGFVVAEGLYRGLGSESVRYSNIKLQHTSDDAFDPANADAQSSTQAGRAGTIISNVELIDCQPPALVGARSVQISNLTLRRCKGGMSVGIQAGNGASSQFGWMINGLTIEDGLESWSDGSQALVGNGDAISANLALGGSSRTSTSIGSTPGSYNYAAQQFYPPWTDAGAIPGFGALYVPSSATYAVIGGYQNMASNINILRTLPDVTNYSDWGFGFLFNKNGWKDPAVQPANRLRSGFWLYGNHNGTLVSKFMIRGMYGAAVYLYTTSAGRAFTTAPATSDARKFAFRNVVFDGFQIIDCLRGSATDFENNGQTLDECSDTDIVWRNGKVVLDPLHISSLRTESGGHPTGAWDTDSTYDWRAFTIRNTKGQRFENIEVAQCYAPFAGVSYPGQYSYSNIRVFCDPVNTAYDANNLGVAVPGGDDFEHVIVDCTPVSGGAASTTYGLVKNHCIRSMLHNDALPVGTYVDGHVIKLRRGTISSGKKKTHLEKIGTNSTWTTEGTDYRYLYQTNS